MNNIVPFNFENQQVRVVMDGQNNPWFNAKDVCGVLGYVNPRDATAKHVDPEDVAKHDTLSTGGIQQANYVNESGLYSLIFGSTKGEAKRFKKWVTSEVLPSLRKTGRYEIPYNTTSATNSTHQIDIDLCRFAMETLRPSEASKIRMISQVAAVHGRPTPYLPDYTEEKSTKSLTELLEIHGANMTARNANKILLEMGVLEIKNRPGTKKDKSSNTVKITKQFKSLTGKGLRFGKNVVSPQNERETQPHYFEDTFHELLGLIADQVDVAA